MIIPHELRTHTGYRLAVLAVLSILLVIVFFMAIAVGSTQLKLGEVVGYLFFETDTTEHRILMKIRVPRVLVAALVGASLALSGCLLQGVMRNPLASPNIIGVSSGAGLAAVTVLILFPGYYYLVTPVAFLGACATTIIVYSLAWTGNTSPLRLVLSGIAVSSFLGAGSNALMIFFPDRVQNVIGFMVGSLSMITWKDFMLMWPYTLTGFLLSMLFSSPFNILLLGDETATSLGVKVERIRMFFILISSLLAASAVSVVGLLGFVGLIVPHLARLLIGNNARYLIPGSTLLGMIIVIGCDMIGRIVLRPLELPVGIIMALLGGPFFLYLLRKKARG